jgi:hypothetical protein
MNSTSIPPAIRNAARLHTLFSLFDGKVGAWQEFLQTQSNQEELLFVEALAEDLRKHPGRLEHLRQLYDELRTLSE